MDLNLIQAALGVVILIIVFYIAKRRGKNDCRVNINRNIDIDREINRIDNLNPREFEYYCGEILKRLKYKSVKVTQATNDAGRDIECIDENGDKVYVEIKHYNKDKCIGRPMLQKLVGSGIDKDIKKFIFITTSKFSKQAIEYGNMANIWLIDRDVIKSLLIEIKS